MLNAVSESRAVPDVTDRPRISRRVVLRISDSWLRVAAESLLRSHGVHIADIDTADTLIVTDDPRYLNARSILIAEPNAGTAHAIMNSLKAAQVGAVVSRSDPRHLMSVIAAVDSGMTVLPQELLQAASIFRRLEPRQLRILSYITTGLTNPQMAARLSVSEQTVKRDVSILLDIFDCKTRVQLVLEARRVGY